MAVWVLMMSLQWTLASPKLACKKCVHSQLGCIHCSEHCSCLVWNWAIVIFIHDQLFCFVLLLLFLSHIYFQCMHIDIAVHYGFQFFFLVNDDMTKIRHSIKSHKFYRKYKLDNVRIRTSEYITGAIRCYWGSKHPVLTGHTHREPCFQIRSTVWPVVKISMSRMAKRLV